MVAANLIAQHKDPPFAFEWLGTFLNTSDFIKVCTSTNALKTLAAFTGDVDIPDPKDRDLTEWVQTFLSIQRPHAERFVIEKEKDKETQVVGSQERTPLRYPYCRKISKPVPCKSPKH